MNKREYQKFYINPKKTLKREFDLNKALKQIKLEWILKL